MSTTSSAFDLSFASMILWAMATRFGVSRMVIGVELVVLTILARRGGPEEGLDVLTSAFDRKRS